MNKFCKLQSLPALLALLLTLGLAAEEWVWAPEYPVGSSLPNFSALDVDGEPVTLKQLAGEKGTLVLFSRSAVW